jgi:hypothetical protein
MVDFVTPGALAFRLAVEPVALPVALVADDPDAEFLELLLHAAARPTTPTSATPLFQRAPDLRDVRRVSAGLAARPALLDICGVSTYFPLVPGCARGPPSVHVQATDL